MKIKKYKNAETYLINHLEIHKPFISNISQEKAFMIEVELKDIADEYTYHDFPSSVELWLDTTDVKELINLLTKLEKMEIK